MRKALLTLTAGVLAGSLITAAPSKADPALGIGISFAFGGSQPDVGLGLRVFSDDKRDEAVATIGVDYMFGSGRLRPTLGAAYLDKDFYLGLDLGYDIQGGTIDFGIGLGGVDTRSPAATTTTTTDAS